MKALVKILVKVGSTDRKQTIALTFLLDNIYIRFGSGLCGRVVGVLMGAGCAPLVAGLFLFCYVCVGGDFVLSLSGGGRSDVVEAFGSTSRYLDDLLSIDNDFFDSMVNRVSLRASVGWG